MEKESRVQLGCALATCLTMFVLLCVAGLVFGLGLNFSGLSIAGLGAPPQAPVIARLVLIGSDGNVYVTDRKGESKVAITSNAVLSETATVRRTYVFPNWSPDSRQLAFVGVSTEGNGSATLYTASAQGGSPAGVYTSVQSLPFYLYWSPDSKRVAFLTQDNNQTISLNYVNADGSGAGFLGQGNPLYFSWSPDSQAVLSHIGGSRRDSADAFIGLHSLTNQGQPQSLSIAPADFLAPAWSPDGKEFLSALMGTAQANDELIASDGQGQHTRTIAKFSGNIWFSWSPDGSHIGYLKAPSTDTGLKPELHVVQSDGSSDQLATKDAAIVFFWSPDGQKIAYLVEASGSQGMIQQARAGDQQAAVPLTWKVLKVADGSVTTLSTFVPSDSFASLLPYFDQYAQSLRVWSPDSSSLVYDAQEQDGTDSISVVDVNAGAAAQRIADGGFAVWSWK